MFTGIIETLGRVQSLSRGAQGSRLEVEFEGGLPGLGESVSVNGVCLTVAGRAGRVLGFDLSPETLERTSLGGLKAGERLNLERALAVGGRLGGHFVSGHVDGVGRVRAVEAVPGGSEMVFSAPAGLIRFVAEKGSIAVEGVSLTCFGIEGDSFKAALIPFTLEHTNLGTKKPGDAVNLEIDLLMRYLHRLRQSQADDGEAGLFVRKTVDWGEL